MSFVMETWTDIQGTLLTSHASGVEDSTVAPKHVNIIFPVTLKDC